jgi:predicted nucleic-acid-binding protein
MTLAAADLLHAFQQMDDSEKRQIMQVLDTPQKNPRQIPSGLLISDSHLTQTSGNNSDDHVEATIGDLLDDRDDVLDHPDPVLEALDRHRQDNAKEELTAGTRLSTIRSGSRSI